MGRQGGNIDSAVNNREFRPFDCFRITIFGLATTALWSSLHSIILPLRIMEFVPESQKATCLGLLTFTGLLLAIAVQPIAGMASDRSGSGWGRRRPFIFVGGILTLSFLPGIGLAGSLATLVAIYYLLQAGANTALGPYQALIPDLVPADKRGLASGIKNLIDVLGGFTFVWLVGQLMDRYSPGPGSQWLWLSLGALAAVFLGTMVFTILTVREPPGASGPRLSFLTTLAKSFRIDTKANPDYIRFLLSRLFFIIPLTTFQVFGLYFFRDVAGVPNPAVVMGNFILVSGGCMLATTYLAGRLSDRMGRRPVALISGIISTAGVGFLFFFHSYLLMLLSSALMGIGFGGLMSSNWALAVDLVPKEKAGQYIGLTNLATAGGSALARLNGPMIDFFNVRSPGSGYSVMLLAAFIFLIASSTLLCRIKKR
ncbi:MAG: MFS transporter [Dehalococcoidales bacterium]|nr:MFS transporter [Dehalococcoidales bacterium]